MMVHRDGIDGQHPRPHSQGQRKRHRSISAIVSENRGFGWGGYQSLSRSVPSEPDESSAPIAKSRDYESPVGRCGCGLAFLGKVAHFCWRLLPVILFVLLVIATGHNSHSLWTLNPGESRVVDLPRGEALSRLVRIHRVSNNQGNLSVYHFALGCPPLSSSTAIETAMNVHLGSGDYTFEEYFLNVGSTVSVKLTLSQGGAILALIKGESALDRWMLEDNDNEGSRSHIVSDYAYAGGKSSAHISYIANNADTYAIAYNNALQSSAVGEVVVSIRSTTFDLQGKHPTCSPDESDCSIGLGLGESGSCIILQVSSLPEGLDLSTSDSIVSVDIMTHRRWGMILVLSALPILLSFLIWGSSDNRCLGAGSTPHDSTGASPATSSLSSFVPSSIRPAPPHPITADVVNVNYQSISNLPVAVPVQAATNAVHD